MGRTTTSLFLKVLSYVAVLSGAALLVVIPQRTVLLRHAPKTSGGGGRHGGGGLLLRHHRHPQLSAPTHGHNDGSGGTSQQVDSRPDEELDVRSTKKATTPVRHPLSKGNRADGPMASSSSFDTHGGPNNGEKRRRDARAGGASRRRNNNNENNATTTSAADKTNVAAVVVSSDAAADGGGAVRYRHRHSHRLVPPDVERLLLTSTMPDLIANTTLLQSCQWSEKESSSNEKFAKVFAEIFQSAFPNEPNGREGRGGGLAWWLDEGGLIGSGRAGSMNNADDDFDFFALLPNQLAPCVEDSVTCTAEQFDRAIHEFLMVFWNTGKMCINKFNPRFSRFKSRRRLMYSFQLNREKQFDDSNPKGFYPYDGDVPCFKESTPFAHMHLGILQEKTGLLKTNVWAIGTTHPMDELDLRDILPVGRCRVGKAEAPCPRNITAYLTVRNRGEYRKKSSDGNCLLVRSKWGMARKKGAVDTVRRLDRCGYNSMADLADAFVASGYSNC